ncbi:hypothetical protein [Alicyclobacillus sacchari]|nr:hypothetical protein [Alicyclobacillus sacchari]
MSHAQGEGFWQAIFKTGVIAIVRGVPAAKMLDVGQALYAVACVSWK